MNLISPIYVGLTALFYVYLAMKVVRLRHNAKAALGDAGDDRLRRAIRAHGNCTEYAPILLLLLISAELLSMPGWLIHICGIVIVGARVLHAWGITQIPEPLRVREISMGLTFFMMVALALGTIAHAIF